MKIKGKFSADVSAFSMKSNQEHDGREACIDLEISVKQDEAEKKFGEAFATLAFATMRMAAAEQGDGEEPTDSVIFLQDAIKPGKAIVTELHRIDIDGQEVTTQPQLLKIRTVKGDKRVVAVVRVPIDVSKASLINALTKSVGKVVKVEFEPAQGVLSFPQASQQEAQA